MQSQEGRKREKFENCLQIGGTSAPERWNGLAIKSVSAMQTKNSPSGEGDGEAKDQSRES